LIVRADLPWIPDRDGEPTSPLSSTIRNTAKGLHTFSFAARKHRFTMSPTNF
jgi:hypothetical protein